jgi:hypothetical protein
MHRSLADQRDADHDIRTPTHELTIARDILKTYPQIALQLPGWALSWNLDEPLWFINNQNEPQKVECHGRVHRAHLG